MSTYLCLTQVYKSSKVVPFDDSSKLVFFSDCHRGDSSWADDFARNQNLYNFALEHYYNQGYTYIEIGDGDELWKNRRFDEIAQAHSDTFRIIRKFYNAGRLYMLLGNHDIVKKGKRFQKNCMYRFYNIQEDRYDLLFDNMEVHEGLILKHKLTGNRIFVFHGHQGDIINDHMWYIGRFLVRYLWRHLELLGFNDPTSPARNYTRKGTVEKNIINWVRANRQMVITGHTHRPMFPNPGQPPYFNDGSCVHPYSITGIEIQNGEIVLVKWSVKVNNAGVLYIERDVIAGPEKLQAFFDNWRSRL